ncbi:uncharacterized protein MYCGRDRAFT_97866 [Zymoseptoria tritici IPO323]|uniref:Uncharacterized protein n=1 Tax=Zymoseptoria tritici (strain CBS 115943 / IPO323) TaxID=336722 RepID=F9XRM1_ZYMTI|nr:uncharacterized protein MYCGRDRAFT_97866 [Zymoseptoria tritici IPO323]EGP82057.1 hypothetical protein MYCGRDRAFT_97866 [Zymoseptoria tritici IPO323]
MEASRGLHVKLWKLPITKDIDHVNQKAGRAVRAQGLTGYFVWFYSYYVDDAQKNVPEGSKHDSMVHRDGGAATPYQPEPARAHEHAPFLPSGPRNTTMAEAGEGLLGDPDQDGDTDDAAAVAAAAARLGISSDDNYHKKDWTKQEIEWREKETNIIRLALNSQYLATLRCCRVVCNHLYEEHLKMYDSVAVDPIKCCSMCNPALLQLILWEKEPPAVPKSRTAPRAGSKQAFFLPKLKDILGQFCRKAFDFEAIQQGYDFDNLLADLPYNLLIEDQYVWELAECIRFEGLERPDSEPELTADDIKDLAPLFSAWHADGGPCKTGHTQRSDKSAQAATLLQQALANSNSMADDAEDEDRGRAAKRGRGGRGRGRGRPHKRGRGGRGGTAGGTAGGETGGDEAGRETGGAGGSTVDKRPASEAALTPLGRESQVPRVGSPGSSTMVAPGNIAGPSSRPAAATTPARAAQ